MDYKFFIFIKIIMINVIFYFWGNYINIIFRDLERIDLGLILEWFKNINIMIVFLLYDLVFLIGYL